MQCDWLVDKVSFMHNNNGIVYLSRDVPYLHDRVPGTLKFKQTDAGMAAYLPGMTVTLTDDELILGGEVIARRIGDKSMVTFLYGTIANAICLMERELKRKPPWGPK